jgi:hypothetical protein
MMNWRGCGRMQSWYILGGNCSSICLEGLGKVLEDQIEDKS